MRVVRAIAGFVWIAGLVPALGCTDAHEGPHAGAGGTAGEAAGSNPAPNATNDASLDAAPPQNEPSLDAGDESAAGRLGRRSIRYRLDVREPAPARLR